MSLERLKTVFDTNILGSVLCAREAARRMSTRRGGQYEGRGGAIVNLSSAAARLGSPNLFVDYATSKGDIDVLTRGLSQELGPAGIRVNAVRPGILEPDIPARAGGPAHRTLLGPQVTTGRSRPVGDAARN